MSVVVTVMPMMPVVTMASVPAVVAMSTVVPMPVTAVPMVRPSLRARKRK
jgi:hypothetical protein